VKWHLGRLDLSTKIAVELGLDALHPLLHRTILFLRTPVMDLAGVPRPIHSDDDLHGLLLGSVQCAFSLDVIESKIPGAGSGIVTSSNIPFGSEIFRAKDALWKVPMNSDIQKTCGNCFSNCASTVSKAGRFCTREQDRPKLLSCGRCKVARYYSKVRSARVL
jgi:hypothetical protein